MPREYYFTFTRKINGIYFPDNSINVTVDTTQGIVISYNLSWYKGDLPKPDNIYRAKSSCNPAEKEIKTLAQYGISLPRSEFKPESNISQRDFLHLIAKSLNSYIDNEITNKNNPDDAIYNYLISLNIVKENEKSQSSLINKQEQMQQLCYTIC